MWRPVRVEGSSMLPTLRPGDFLAVRALHADEPRIGQLVVADIQGREVVKRVADPPDGRALAPGEWWLEGDNSSASTDSRTIGPIPATSILAVVGARYWPLTRLRRF